jgi:hypothetical protein
MRLETLSEAPQTAATSPRFLGIPPGGFAAASVCPGDARAARKVPCLCLVSTSPCPRVA